MPTLETRMHPGVMPVDTSMRARFQRGPHLVAGDLSGACGVLALWTGLIVLGVITKAQVRDHVAMLSDDRFEETWRRGWETWFDGTNEDEMIELINTVSSYIDHRHCTGSMRDQVEFVTQSLRRKEVVLLGLEGLGGRNGHWVLAVGSEELISNEKRKVIGILCLDSGEPAPQLLRFNARLELHMPHRGATYVRYRKSSGGTNSMTIDTAISIRRRSLPRRTTKERS